MSNIKTIFLQDINNGGNPEQPHKIAQALAKHIAAAQKTLHLAVFDFKFQTNLADPVVRAIMDRAGAGVEVQIAYDKRPAGTKFVNDPLGSGGVKTVGTEAYLQSTFPEGSKVQLYPISDPQLMHNKYVIRDGHTPQAAVWTGSTNLTSDAWSFQDNNVIILNSPQIAARYETDFDELIANGVVKGTGIDDSGTATVDNLSVETDFCPGDHPAVVATIVTAINNAKTRVAVASMVLSSSSILGALSDAIERGVAVSGVYDGGETDGALRAIKVASKIQLIKEVTGHLVAKDSVHFNPHKPDGPYNYMHNKILVADDVVVTGSFNWSQNAEKNAENIVTFEDAAFARQYADYIQKLADQYSKGTNPPG